MRNEQAQPSARGAQERQGCAGWRSQPEGPKPGAARPRARNEPAVAYHNTGVNGYLEHPNCEVQLSFIFYQQPLPSAGHPLRRIRHSFTAELEIETVFNISSERKLDYASQLAEVQVQVLTAARNLANVDIKILSNFRLAALEAYFYILATSGLCAFQADSPSNIFTP